MPYSYNTIDEFCVGFDFQREWIEGQGILLVFAFFLSGVGGGLFLTSLLIGWKTGLLVGMAIVAIGSGGAFLLHMGRPLRFWRVFWRPQSSWLSRGTYFIFLYIIFGLAYYLIGGMALMAVAAFFAFCLIIYSGFAMAVSPAIPFWNNPLLPMVFVSSALWGGTSLAEVVHSFLPETALNVEVLGVWGFWLGVIAVVFLYTYLTINYYSNVAAKEAVLFLVKGRLSVLFYAGVVGLGIVIPLAILTLSYFGKVEMFVLAVAGISELVGSFVLRYSLLKAGMYPPVA